MGFILFLLAATFCVLWLNERSKSNNSSNDVNQGEYSQGYWDGYRAFGDKAKHLLGRQDTSDELGRLIAAGEQGEPSSVEGASLSREVEEIIEDGDESQSFAWNQESLENEDVGVSTEQLKAQEEKETLRNLNVLLYVASFLIVAAAALFVTLTMPASVKLLSLILVTTVFYISGLVLHVRSDRLKPAAVAFVGTGLAILPFVGFALTSLGGMSGEMAWLVTSMVGLIAYGVAAVRLQSELISYLTMAFVLSLALSAVSTLGVSMVWYFIVVIGVSLICNCVYVLWPKLVPTVFMLPVEQTGQITTPIALIASLFVISHMDIFMYEVLYGIATAHYLVVWLVKRAWLYELLVRVLAHITLLIVAADVTQLSTAATADTRVEFGVWVLVLAALQAGYSLLRVKPTTSDDIVQAERLVMVAAIGIMVCTQVFWIGSAVLHEMTAANLTIIGCVALAATLRFREAGWAYVGLGASVLLPFVLLRGVIDPAVSYEVIAGGFTILGLLALLGLDRASAAKKSQSVQAMIGSSVGVYALCAAFAGVASGEGLTLTWTALLAGALYVGLSYVTRLPALEVVGAIFGVGAIVAGVGELQVSDEWRLVLISVGSTGALLVASLVHHFNSEQVRRNGLVVIAAVMLSLLVFAATGSDVLVQRLATILLLAAAIAGIGIITVLRRSGDILSQVGRAAYAVYPLLALIVAWQAGEGWTALALAVLAGIFWMSSYVEKSPGVMVVGNVALLFLLATLWQWLEFDSSWQLFGIAWLASVVYYALYWLATDKQDMSRQWIALMSLWVVLGGVAFVYIWTGEPHFILAAAGSFMAIAATLGVQGYRIARQDYIEASVYIATFAAQRITEVLLPETNMVVYGHWWAIAIAMMAWWRAEDRQVRAMIALGLVTASTGIYALAGEPGYSLVFLVEHLIILIFGALLRKSWVMWWGLVATVVAVLYFLRDYAFLAPLFLGMILIIFVVWRLVRMGDKK